MFNVSRKFPVILGALACSVVALCATPSFADDASLIVLKATGAPFKPGDKVAGSAALKLTAGQSVTLIASDGKMINVQGPYEGQAAHAGDVKTASVTDMLGSLVNKSKVETATPGVVRNAAAAGPNSDPWVLDASKDGNFCFHQAVMYDVWRPDGTKADVATIAPAAGGPAVDVNFAPGETRTALPDAVSFEDGKTYKVSVGGHSSEITVHAIPESVPLDKVAVAWFAQDKCEVQANALLKTLKN